MVHNRNIYIDSIFETGTSERVVLYCPNTEEDLNPQQAILRDMEVRNIVNDGILLPTLDSLSNKICSGP